MHAVNTIRVVFAQWVVLYLCIPACSNGFAMLIVCELVRVLTSLSSIHKLNSHNNSHNNAGKYLVKSKGFRIYTLSFSVVLSCTGSINQLSRQLHSVSNFQTE